jgi:hypothetical protein
VGKIYGSKGYPQGNAAHIFNIYWKINSLVLSVLKEGACYSAVLRVL